MYLEVSISYDSLLDYIINWRLGIFCMFMTISFRLSSICRHDDAEARRVRARGVAKIGESKKNFMDHLSCVNAL